MELPAEASLRWIVSSYGGLLSRHGDGIGTPELVQPTRAYFPDPVAADAAAMVKLVAKMLEYTPVRADVDVGLRFVDDSSEDGEACGTGGCGTGGCAPGSKGAKEATLRDRVLESGDGYVFEIPLSAMGHPVALAATLVRGAGSLVLLEAEEDVTADELGGMSELAAVAAGFGVLLVSGAHVYGKSCGGARVSRHTHLSLEELSVALALFAEVHGVKPGAVKEYLEVTQREAFDEAHAWALSNPRIVRDLGARPEVLDAGLFRCEETKGVLGRFFSRRAAAEEDAGLMLAPVRR